MKTLALVLALLQTSSLGISTSYDKFTDETTVINRQSIMPAKPGFVLLETVAIVKGKDMQGATPISVGIMIASYSDDWVFGPGDHEFRVLYNNKERYSLGTIKRRQADVQHGGVIEVLYLPATLKDIEKLASADALEIQVGPLESEVKAEQQESIKRWLKLFTAK